MAPRLCVSGEYEPMKATVHAAACGLAAAMAAYNGAAWMYRREPHLALNGCVYAALVVWEWKKLRSHLWGL